MTGHADAAVGVALAAAVVAAGLAGTATAAPAPASPAPSGSVSSPGVVSAQSTVSSPGVVSAQSTVSSLAASSSSTGATRAADVTTGPVVGTPVEYRSPAYGGGAIEIVLDDPVATAVESADVEVWVDGRPVGGVTVHEGTGHRLVVSTTFGDLLPVRNVVVNVTGSQGSTDSGVAVGNRSVAVTGGTLALAADGNEFALGATVAAVTADRNTTVELGENGRGGYQVLGTGAHSKVATFDTGRLRTGDGYWVRSDANNASYGLTSLGLSGNLSETTALEGDTVHVGATANFVGRVVQFRLVGPYGGVAARTTGTIGSDGSALASFEVDDPGTYDVVVVDARSAVSRTVGTLTVRDLGAGRMTVPDTAVVDQRGDVLDVPLAFEGFSRTGTVVVGSAERNFRVTVRVTDDGDGEATLHWNTYAAGNATGGLYVSGAASATFDVTEGVSGPIAPGRYRLAVLDEDGIASLGATVVAERSLRDVSVFTVPAAEVNRSAPPSRDVLAADDTVAVDDRTGRDDWVVVRLSATGLEGYVDGVADLNGTAGLSASVVEVPSTVGVNERPVRVPVSRLYFFDRGDDDAYWLAFPPDALSGATPGDRFRVRVSVGDDNPVTDGPEAVETTFRLVAGNVSVDVRDDRLFVPGRRGATVRGTATYAPGTELTVKVWNRGGRVTFAKQRVVRVRDDGTWAAAFDLSNATAGQPLAVRVDKFDLTRAGVRGQVGRRNVSVSMARQTATDAGTLVTVAEATLGQGGFVAIHRGGPDGEVVGVSDALAPGRTFTDLEIRLDDAVEQPTRLVAVAHLDTDDDGTFDHVVDASVDVAYRPGGGPAMSGNVVEPPSTPTPTPAETSTPTVTPTATPAGTPTAGTSSEAESASLTGTATGAAVEATTSADRRRTGSSEPTAGESAAASPGLGAGVALAALLAVALLAVRRS